MKYIVILLAMTLLARPALAMDEGVPEDLHDADYITAVDVEADVPHGELYVDEAVIAIFPRLEDRLSGMLIGRVRLRMKRPPQAAGTPTDSKTARPIEFKVEQAFLSASTTSEWKIAPKGRALQARRWDGLKPDEREAFLKMYNETREADWGTSVASGEGTARVNRDPAGKEFFTAFWGPIPSALNPTGRKDVLRFDFRVDGTGNAISLTDVTDNMPLFQSPAAAAPATAPASGTAPSGTSQ